MIDFKVARVSIVVFLRVGYVTASGDAATARWCGPRARTSGGRSVVDLEGDGVAHNYRARVASFKTVLDLGGLKNHVVTLNNAPLRVQMSGPADDLYLNARDGFWQGREAVAWAMDTITGATQEIFRGRCSRNPKVDETGFDLRITDDPVGFAASFPMIQMPTTEDIGLAVFTHDSTNTDNITHAWHPKATTGDEGYALNPSHEGLFVGHFYGEADALSYREVAYYGQNDFVSGGSYLFFAMSPQFDCFAHAIYWEFQGEIYWVDANNNTNAPNTARVRTFNCRDSAMGPVGTCVRLQVNDQDFEPFASDPFPRVVVLGSGPGHATIQGTAESGAIEYMDPVPTGTGIGDPGTIIDRLFSDLLAAPQELHPDSSADLRTAVPLGPRLGNDDWQQHVGPVPTSLVPKALTLREALGAQAAQLGADWVRRPDAGDAGRMKIKPERRRPRGSADKADHVIKSSDFARGSGATLLGWSILDDPRGDYATKINWSGPDTFSQPLPSAAETGGAFAPSWGVHAGANLEPGFQPTDTFTDRQEEADTGLSVPTSRALPLYRPQTTQTSKTIWRDCLEVLSGQYTQRQRWIRALLGHRALAIMPAETVAYEVTGLPSAVGQARKLVQDWTAQRVEIHTWHGVFFPGVGIGDGNE